MYSMCSLTMYLQKQRYQKSAVYINLVIFSLERNLRSARSTKIPLTKTARLLHAPSVYERERVPAFLPTSERGSRLKTSKISICSQTFAENAVTNALLLKFKSLSKRTCLVASITFSLPTSTTKVLSLHCF